MNENRLKGSLGPMPPLVARCNRCGKGFVWMNPDEEYLPCPYSGCGGEVVHLTEEEYIQVNKERSNG